MYNQESNCVFNQHEKSNFSNDFTDHYLKNRDVRWIFEKIKTDLGEVRFIIKNPFSGKYLCSSDDTYDFIEVKTSKKISDMRIRWNINCYKFDNKHIVELINEKSCRLTSEKYKTDYVPKSLDKKNELSLCSMWELIELSREDFHQNNLFKCDEFDKFGLSTYLLYNEVEKQILNEDGCLHRLPEEDLEKEKDNPYRTWIFRKNLDYFFIQNTKTKNYLRHEKDSVDAIHVQNVSTENRIKWKLKFYHNPFKEDRNYIQIKSKFGKMDEKNSNTIYVLTKANEIECTTDKITKVFALLIIDC